MLKKTFFSISILLFFGLNAHADTRMQINSAFYGTVDATAFVSYQCNNTIECQYLVQRYTLGDGGNTAAAKPFFVNYSCGGIDNYVIIQGEADRQLARLSCSNSCNNDQNGMKIENARYGNANVIAFVASICNGTNSCQYLVSRAILGIPDAIPAQAFTVTYSCGRERNVATLSPEASGQVANLKCDDDGDDHHHGDHHDGNEVNEYQFPHYPSLGAGDYRLTGGEIYYVNANGESCIYGSWDEYQSFGGGTWSQLDRSDWRLPVAGTCHHY